MEGAVSTVPEVDQTGPSTSPTQKTISTEDIVSNGPVAGGSGTGAINWERVTAAKTKLEDAKLLLKKTPIYYPTVIDLLDEACDILKLELGDLSIETTEALFYFGTALLEQYQTGEHLVGSTAKKVIDQYATELVVEAATDLATDEPETDDGAEKTGENGDETIEEDGEEDGDDDEEDEQDNEDEAEGEASNQSDLQTLPGGASLDEQAATNGSSMDVVAPEMPDESETPADAAEGTDVKADSAAEGDSIPELRYAWEILETARVGYEKRVQEGGATLDEKLRLSDIHYKLSLCAAENGQQNLALIEAERSLNVCKDACGPTDRELAEAYFNVGSVMSVYGMLSEAAENMKAAVAVLENRKAQILNQVKALSSDESNKNQIDRLQGEFKDIDDLIPDLMTRIQDTYEDMRLGSEDAKQMLSDWLKGVSEKSNADNGISPDPAKPVSDISHLIRRVKRTTTEEDEAAKKLKTADGSAVVTGSNGHVVSQETQPEAPVV